MNFVSIDFETANEKRNSPCSIGIAVIRNGEIVEKVHYLIKPKEMRFMPINIGIHGIRSEMVRNELEFDKVWEKIKHYFNDNLVIAHNASFDISVLRNTLELYRIEVPSFQYICTMKLSKNFYIELDNVRLNTVNKLLGFEFKHHDALADAIACANILLNIAEELGTKDISKISILTGVTLGRVDKNGYIPSSTTGRIISRSSRHPSKKNEETGKYLNYGIFENEVVVFTGSLASMTRDEAIGLVKRIGGAVGSSVTKKTTCLITNTKEVYDLTREEMSNKLKKTMDLKKKGQDIRILNEEEFLKLCFN